MTLTEYINQENTVFGNIVYLEHNEYIEHYSSNKELRLVEIPIIYEKFGINGTYVMYNDSDTLYTHDKNGKPKYISVFRIKK